MSLRPLWAMALCLTTLGACSLGPKLTDQHVTNYIKAYQAIRQESPALAAKLGRQDLPPEQALAEFRRLEGTIKRAGFKDCQEFVTVNAAVAWAFSQGQARAYMGDVDKAQGQAHAEIDAKLKDPAVPEEVKVQLRATKAAMQSAYQKNKQWANVSMDVTSKLTDKDSIKVVMRHRKELEAAFMAR